MIEECLRIRYFIILVTVFTILILLTPPCNISEEFVNTSYNWYYYNLPFFRYLDNRDKSVLYDPFVAPEKRVQADQYPFPLINRNVINYPTRGYPENYQQLGIVTRTNDEKILQLFGRPTFPRSTQWEYYVRSEKDGFINKIPIQTKNQREIENGDEVNIPGMNSQNGLFKVQLFNNDAPRYNPYYI